MALKLTDIHNVHQNIKFIRMLRTIAKRNVDFKNADLVKDCNNYEYFIFNVLKNSYKQNNNILVYFEPDSLEEIRDTVVYIKMLKAVSKYDAKLKYIYNQKECETLDLEIAEGILESLLVDTEYEILNSTDYIYAKYNEDLRDFFEPDFISVEGLLFNGPIYQEFIRVCDSLGLDPVEQVSCFVDDFNEAKGRGGDYSYLELYSPTPEEFI